MKKFLGLILAGVMVLAMSTIVFAKPWGQYTTSKEDLEELHGFFQYPSNLSSWDVLPADVREAYIAEFGDPFAGGVIAPLAAVKATTPVPKQQL